MSVMDSVQHVQIKLIAKDIDNFPLPNTILSVPTTTKPEDLNDLVNSTASENDDEWKNLTFDFLVTGILFRGDFANFLIDNNVSQESTIDVECILRQPAPEPDQELPHDDWISGVKVVDKYIFTTTYGGELTAYTHKGKKVGFMSFGEDPLKCIDVFTVDKELCVVTGSQDQALTLSKVELSGKNIKFTPWQTFRGHERSVECVAAKPDGTRLVSGGFDSLLKVWNTEHDEKTEFVKNAETPSKKKKGNTITKTPMVTLQSHKDAIVDVTWHPSNPKQVVTVSMDCNIIAWDLELAGFVSRLFGSRPFTSVSMNPQNGLIVTGSTDDKVRLWDLKSQEGALVKQVYEGHLGWVTDICWSPTNVHQFITGSFDQTVRLWDMRSPRAPLYDIIGHDDRVLAVDWSYPGIVASGAADNLLRTFKVQT